MSAPRQHLSFDVDPGCARRLATAAVRYQLTRPAVVVLVGLEVVFGLVAAISGSWVLGLGLIVAAAAIGVTPLLTRGKVAAALEGSGYRPGSTVTTDWYDENFVITTDLAHATHFYRDVRSVRRLGRSVGIRMQTTRLLLLLPTELVPDDFGAASRRGAGTPGH